MSKWEMVRLGDVAKINMGQSPKSSSYNEKGEGIPFYQGNADFGALNPKVRYYCSEPTKIASKNDILLSVRAPIGALNISIEKCCIGRGLAAITKIEGVTDCKFLYYVLMSKYDELNLKGTGSTFKAINKQNLSDIVFSLPPLETQKQIAKTLDTASELINLRKKQLEELDNLIKSVFYDMFGDPVTNEKGWKRVGVSDVFNIIDGDRGKNYPRQDEFLDEGYCLFLNTSNVTKKGFNFDNLKFISEEKDQQLRKGKVNKGDIILTTRGTVGNIAYYDKKIPYDVVRINSGMVILRTNSNEISPEFFCELFKNPDMEREIESYKSGTAQPQLPIINLKRIKIVLPPLPLQTKFAQIVSKIEEQKALVQKAIDESQYLFDSLISKYFD